MDLLALLAFGASCRLLRPISDQFGMLHIFGTPDQLRCLELEAAEHFVDSEQICLSISYCPYAFCWSFPSLSLKLPSFWLVYSLIMWSLSLGPCALTLAISPLIQTLELLLFILYCLHYHFLIFSIFDSTWHALSITLYLCQSPYLVPVQTYYERAPMAFAIDQLWLLPCSDFIYAFESMSLWVFAFRSSFTFCSFVCVVASDYNPPSEPSLSCSLSLI